MRSRLRVADLLPVTTIGVRSRPGRAALSVLGVAIGIAADHAKRLDNGRKELAQSQIMGTADTVQQMHGLHCTSSATDGDCVDPRRSARRNMTAALPYRAVIPALVGEEAGEVG
jgi:hypothetical protein